MLLMSEMKSCPKGGNHILKRIFMGGGGGNVSLEKIARMGVIGLLGKEGGPPHEST